MAKKKKKVTEPEVPVSEGIPYAESAAANPDPEKMGSTCEKAGPPMVEIPQAFMEDKEFRIAYLQAKQRISELHPAEGREMNDLLTGRTPANVNLN